MTTKKLSYWFWIALGIATAMACAVYIPSTNIQIGIVPVSTILSLVLTPVIVLITGIYAVAAWDPEVGKMDFGPPQDLDSKESQKKE